MWGLLKFQTANNMLHLTMSFCRRIHWKWENDLHLFPWQSWERTSRQFWKRMSYISIETYITNPLCKNLTKIIVNLIFNKHFLLLSVYFYCTRYVDKYTSKSINLITCTPIHSLFCALNSVLYTQAEQSLPKVPTPRKRLSWPGISAEKLTSQDSYFASY
jgi:hypothetical protein